MSSMTRDDIEQCLEDFADEHGLSYDLEHSEDQVVLAIIDPDDGEILGDGVYISDDIMGCSGMTTVMECFLDERLRNLEEKQNDD